MKKSALFLSAMLPLSLGQGLDIPDFNSRAFDPRIDNPSRLSPRQPVERDMRKIALITSARARQRAWSDRRWNFNNGLLGERYTDRNYMRQSGLQDRIAYNTQYPAEGALRLRNGSSEQEAWLRILSPAEKYDLIMGTVRGGLYDSMNQSLLRDLDSSGRFPGWWGICEGSAASSIASEEPVRSITVHSEAYGIDVPFYASDIKGLTSLLWSAFNKNLRLPEMGQQCQDRGKIGEVDGDKPSCFDTNPGSFLMAIHHFVGQGNGKLIFDTDATRVVWNHPATGYKMQFFRPGRASETVGFEDAVLPARDAEGDPRRRLRSPGTVYIVGVNMQLTYGDNEKQVPLEGAQTRKDTVMNLNFEVELDAGYGVLGGEWLVARHPDLAWVIPDNLRPDTAGDRSLGGGSWDGYSVPASWSQASLQSSNGVVPLRRVVEGLVRRSSSGRD